MRHDHNSSLWASARPRRVWSRRLAFAGVALVVTAIAVSSLRDQVRGPSASACVQAWPYLDAGCGENGTTAAELTTRPVRVIGIDRNAPAVVAKAAPVEARVMDGTKPAVATLPAGVPPAGAAPMIAKSDQPSAPQRIQVSLPALAAAAATDGAGRETTVKVDVTAHPAPAAAAAPISEEDLTFRTGAAHRPGATVTVKEEAVAPEPARKAASKPRRTMTRQTVELPDGRRVTITRGQRDVQDPYGWRVRAADMGPRFEDSSGGFFGARREPRGLGGLY